MVASSESPSFFILTPFVLRPERRSLLHFDVIVALPALLAFRSQQDVGGPLGLGRRAEHDST